MFAQHLVRFSQGFCNYVIYPNSSIFATAFATHVLNPPCRKVWCRKIICSFMKHAFLMTQKLTNHFSSPWGINAAEKSAQLVEIVKDLQHQTHST